MVCYQSSLATKRPVSVPRLATTVESASDRVVLRLRIAARPVSMGNHHRVRDPIMVICRARPLLGVYYLRAAWLRSAITGRPVTSAGKMPFALNWCLADIASWNVDTFPYGPRSTLSRCLPLSVTDCDCVCVCGDLP